MKRSLEKIIKVLFIIIVITALVAPRAVLAQDVVPTEEPAATEVVTTDVPTEAPVVEETAVVTEAATEVATEVVTELPTEVPTEEATEAAVETAAPTEVPVEEESVAEVVEALAEVEAILVDEDGNPIALGSAQAEEALSSGDPWFVDNTNNKHLIAYFASEALCNDWYANPPEGAGDPTYTYNCYWSGISAPIQAAINDDKSTGSTIHLTGTFSNETINITKSVTIDGGGTTTINAPTNITTGAEDLSYDGQDYYGLLYIHNGSTNITVNIQNLTLNGSTFTGYSGNNNAVGVLIGSRAIVNIFNTTITGFAQTGGSNPNNGIGIAQFSNNRQTLTLNQDNISNNNIGYLGGSNSYVEGEHNNFLNNTNTSLDFYHGRILNSFWGLDPFSSTYFGTARAETENQYYFYYDFDHDGINESGEQVYYLFLNCPKNQYETLDGSPCTFNGTTIDRSVSGFLHYGKYTSIYSKTNFEKFATGAKLGDIEPYEIWPLLSERYCPAGTEYDGKNCVPEKKMDICHSDSGYPNYTLNNVSVKSVLNTTTCTLKSSGHGGDPYDIIPPYTCAPDVTFAGQGDQAILALGCVVPAPAFTLTKTVNEPKTSYTIGDWIHYDIEVFNTGNVVLPSLIIQDDNAIFDPTTCGDAADLAVGASRYCKAAHQVTVSDAPGTYRNTATVTNSGITVASSADVLIDSSPAFTLTKTVNEPKTSYTIGDWIHYDIEVFNTGNVVLPSLIIQDDNAIFDPTTCGDAADLAVGASRYCKAAHQVTVSDAAGTYRNTATVTNSGITVASSADVLIDSSPAITIVKSIDTTIFAGPYVENSTIPYSIVVTNTGNVTMTDVTVLDLKADIVGACSAASLAPGETFTCIATHLISPEDIENGLGYTNTASVTGTYNGVQYSKSSQAEAKLDIYGCMDETAINYDPTATLDNKSCIAPAAAISLSKNVSPTSYGVVGAMLGYTYTVTNEGNVPVTGLSVNDYNGLVVSCPVTTLAPAAVVNCTASYTTKQSDIDSGLISNTAIANATYIEEEVPSNESTAVAIANTGPALFVAKTITSAGPYVAGSTITYSLVITNTGNVTLTDVAVADPNAAFIGTCSAASLAPAASFTCAASHVVSALDIAAGLSYLNTATATSGTTTASGSVTAALDILGCMDPTATNYNASATIADGSCTYPVTPPIIVPVTGATPALAIPVTGGALIPVTGGTLIVSGLGHSCMTYNNGQVICWGLNASGQLGDGTTADKLEPVYVKDLMGVQNLTAGGKHTCALTIDGEIWCWGENSSGQLGNGTTKNSTVPVKVAGLPDKVLSITAGEEFTCVQLMNQEVWCWGKNDLGQLNDGTTKNQSSPVKSKLTTMLAQISGGQGLLLGSDVLGSVNEWVKAQAAAVKQLASSLSISANRWGDTGCAVASDGSIKCWGSDLISIPVTGGLPAMEVGTGLDHNCSINTDESISCWGSNDSGQLGDGTNKDSVSATLVKNLTKAHALAVGAHHTCILSGTSNIAYCWGENSFGQLGNNTTTNSNVPVLVTLPK